MEEDFIGDLERSVEELRASMNYYHFILFVHQSEKRSRRAEMSASWRTIPLFSSLKIYRN